MPATLGITVTLQMESHVRPVLRIPDSAVQLGFARAQTIVWPITGTMVTMCPLLLVRRMQALIVFSRRWNPIQCVVSKQNVYSTLDTRDLQAVLVLTPMHLLHLATPATRAQTAARARLALPENTKPVLLQQRARIAARSPPRHWRAHRVLPAFATRGSTWF